MNKYRIVLIVCLLFVATITIGYMNTNYDKLARNTFVTKENHDLLLKRLDEEQIIYIVEHNEDVNVYDDYLSIDSFVFDNRYLYAAVYNVRKGTPYTIVNFVNNVAGKMAEEDLLYALQYYDYALLKELVLNRSYYNPGAEIVLNPDDFTLHLGITNTIGRYKPTDLILLSSYDHIAISDEELRLRKEAADALNNMCAYLGENSTKQCGGLTVSAAYMSYEENADLYTNALSEVGPVEAFETYGYPSHNEHQLGLAVDFSCEDEAMLMKMRRIANKFGFVYYYGKDVTFAHMGELGHLRYVGSNNVACYEADSCISEE